MLLDKQAVVTSLEDAEQKYHDWKSALQQILGETEIQKISDVHINSTNHPDPMRSQYIATISRVWMQDFCLSRKAER